MNYTVSANGGTVVVSDDSEVVRYTSQSLVYGDVLVSAINSCGQESTPALLNIPTSGTINLQHMDFALYLLFSIIEPPELAQRTVEMECTTPLNDGRLVNIAWMVSLMVCNDAKCSFFQEGPREPGVVYLGEEEVNVVLDSGNIACLNEIDNDMSCTATIKEDGSLA